MERITLSFAYDGTRFHGLQRQKNTKYTIQEFLEDKLSQIFSSRVNILASGRTDTGVHARIQVAHADVPDGASQRYAGPGNRLQRLELALNSILPHDIRIYRAEKSATDFHAIAKVAKKTYVYFIDPNPIQAPSLRNYAWHLRLPMDWAAIEKATSYLQGTHDFKAFCNKGSLVKTTERHIFEAYWGAVMPREFPCSPLSRPLMAFRITGDGFLKQMVRLVVGTLVHIGMKRSEPELIQKMIETGNHSLSGATAPSHGLWLWDILYLT